MNWSLNRALKPTTAGKIDDLLAWYRANLLLPPKFSLTSLKGHYRRKTTRGLSWLKPTALTHLAKAYELAALLEQHGHAIVTLKTSRPGYLIYEDEHQIVAEPLAEALAR